MAFKKKQKTPAAASGTDPVEVPRAGLPDATKLERRARWMRRYIMAAAFLFPLSLLMSLVALTGNGEAAPAPVVNPADEYAATKPVAMVTTTNWLTATPSPLPGGVLLSWDKAEKIDSGKRPADVTPEEFDAHEVHTMTIVGPDGGLFTANVQLAISKTQGIRVVGEPSLIPRVPETDLGWSGSSPWPTLTAQASAPAEVEQAVTAWARAYTSGDPDALRLAVQDATRGNAYVPLTGYALQGVNITHAAWMFTDDDTKNQATDTDRMLVRVEMSASRGVRMLPGEAAPVITFDLLIEKANTASPVIVAWGGPGTGLSLKKYGNAETGRVVAATPATEETPDPAAITPTAPVVPTTPAAPAAGQ